MEHQCLLVITRSHRFVHCNHACRVHVCGNRDDSGTAEGQDRERYIVISGDHTEIFILGFFNNPRHLADVTARYLDAHDVGVLCEFRHEVRLEVLAGPSRDIVRD